MRFLSPDISKSKEQEINGQKLLRKSNDIMIIILIPGQRYQTLYRWFESK